jgi:hypothetical protein
VGALAESVTVSSQAEVLRTLGSRLSAENDPLPNLIPAPGTLQNFVGIGVTSGGVSTQLEWRDQSRRPAHQRLGEPFLPIRLESSHSNTTNPFYGIPGADSIPGDANDFFRGNFGGASAYVDSHHPHRPRRPHRYHAVWRGQHREQAGHGFDDSRPRIGQSAEQQSGQSVLG